MPEVEEHTEDIGGVNPVMYPENEKCSSVQSRIAGSSAPNRSATMSSGLPTKMAWSRIHG